MISLRHCFKDFKYNKLISIEDYNKLKCKLKDMKTRCYNSNHKDYKYYGAKGITVCKEWMENPDIFVEWCIDNGYKKGQDSIDRIDSKRGYEPSNCRMVSFDFNTRYIKGKERKKKKYSSVSLYFKSGCQISFETIKSRIKANWQEEDILNKPVRKKRVSLKVLKQMINMNISRIRIDRIYKRFEKDNDNCIYRDDFLKGKELYYQYINISCPSHSKLDYLDKRYKNEY